MDSTNYDRDRDYDRDAESTPSYLPEDRELDLPDSSRYLSATPEDVMDMLDDSESDSK